MPADLRGKVAIVTGGSRGIGLTIAALLAEHGASIAVSARSENALETVTTQAFGRLRSPSSDAERASDPASRVLAIAADVREYVAVQHLVDATVQNFGGLDILVNNAGIGAFGNVADQSVETWRSVVDTNLTGVFNCCRASIPHLRRRGGGWIINISSLAGENPFAGGAAYCASKAGLNAFSEALMQELRYDDIRVSCILPGSVRTGFAGHEEGDHAQWKLAPDDVARVVLDLIGYDRRSLPSRVDLRPSKPRK